MKGNCNELSSGVPLRSTGAAFGLGGMHLTKGSTWMQVLRLMLTSCPHNLHEAEALMHWGDMAAPKLGAAEPT